MRAGGGLAYGRGVLKVQVWILNSRTSEVLLLKTQERGEHGSFWQPVTGSVEEGETLEQAALREATEETALRFAGPPRSLDYSFEFEGWGKLRRETAFWLETAEGREKLEVKLDPKEHKDFRWAPIKQAEGELKFETNREALRLLAKKKGI